MSTEPKMTPWFVNGEKPAHKGVYNVSCQRSRQSGRWWSYFDGDDFRAFATQESAEEVGEEWFWSHGDRGAGICVLTEGSWRGLAEQPA